MESGVKIKYTNFTCTIAYFVIIFCAIASHLVWNLVGSNDNIIIYRKLQTSFEHWYIFI